MKPVVDRLRGEYAGTVEFVVFAELSSRPDASDFAVKQRVSVIPTMVLVSEDGTELQRVIGSLPEADLRELLDAVR